MTPVVVSGSGGCALSDMRTELQARGMSELTSARATDALNQAYRELLAEEDWPFLETTTSGTAPVTISDLREVLSVRDSTTDTVIPGTDVRLLYELNPDLDTSGSPQYWWLDGLTTLRVWPLNTSDTISVRYLKRVNNLTADADTTVFPSDWCYLVILGAQLQLQGYDVDNPDLADRLQGRYDRGLDRMRRVYLERRNYTYPPRDQIMIGDDQ